MSENTEFNLDEVLSDAPADVQEVVAKPAKKTARKAAKKIDPEDDRDNWPVIRIARVKGRPNFHFCAASGTREDGRPFNHELKVMRGVDVPVPPSIVNMLNSTFRTEYDQTYDPVTGRGVLEASDVPPIPWQLVERGPHIK